MNKYKNIFVSGLVTVASFTLADISHGEIICDNMGSEINGGIIISYAAPTDDFILESDAIATGAGCIIQQHSSVVWDYSMEWMIFDDAGGNPGGVLHFGTAENFVIQNSDPSYSGNGLRLDVTFDFGQGIGLVGGETYWFALHALNVAAGENGLGWAGRRFPIGNTAKHQLVPLNATLGDTLSNTPWDSSSVYDLQFAIHGIPEPASIGLIGLVSGGVYFARRFFIA